MTGWVMNSQEKLHFSDGLVISNIFEPLVDYLSHQNSELPNEILRRFDEYTESHNTNFVPISLAEEAFYAAENLLEDKLIALHCGQFAKVKLLGSLGYLCTACPTPKDALAFAASYSELLLKPLEVCIHENENETVLCLNGQAKFWRYLTEFVFGYIVKFYQEATDTIVPIQRIIVPWDAKEPIEKYEELTGGATWTFGASQVQVVFANEIMNKQMLSHDPYLHGIMLQKTKHLFGQSVKEELWLNELRSYIAENISFGTPTLDEVSSHLKLGEKTLRRRLEKKGLSFSGVTDSIREEIGTTLIQETQYPLKEISAILGFSEQSSFQRAFKKWTGFTPLQYRKNLHLNS